MIANISDKMVGFKGILDYHEKKVNKGVADLLYNSLCAGSSYKDFNTHFNLCANQNDRVKKKCYDISLNLPPGENLSNEKLVELSLDYLKKLNIENTPFLIHKHRDKDHEHVHITLSRVNRDGKVIDDNFIKFRSEINSRELEKMYGLRSLIELNYDKKYLSEINQRQYNFQKALLTGLRNKAIVTPLRDLIDKDMLLFIKKNTLTNSQLSDLLGDKTKDTMGLLLNNNHFNVLFKDELKIKLEKIYTNSQSKSEFFKECERGGIGVTLSTSKGVSKYNYSLIDLGMVFKEDRLPKKYSYNELLMVPDTRVNVIKSEQKHELYNLIHISIKDASSFESFQQRLKSNGVDIQKNLSNGKEVYLFNLNNCGNAVFFDGESINKRFNFKNINDHFTFLEQKSLSFDQEIIDQMIKEKDLKDNNYLPVVKLTSRHKKVEEAPLNQKKKKKRHGRSM